MMISTREAIIKAIINIEVAHSIKNFKLIVHQVNLNQFFFELKQLIYVFLILI